jgi:hypothetical protein
LERGRLPRLKADRAVLAAGKAKPRRHYPSAEMPTLLEFIRSFVHLVKKPHDILIGHSQQRPPKVVMHQLKNSLTFGISQ